MLCCVVFSLSYLFITFLSITIHFYLAERAIDLNGKHNNTSLICRATSLLKTLFALSISTKRQTKVSMKES